MWSSPAVLRLSDSASKLSNPGFESLVEEDGYVPGKGRKRTLFSRRSGEWRFSRDDISVSPEGVPYDEALDGNSSPSSSSHLPESVEGIPSPPAKASDPFYANGQYDTRAQTARRTNTSSSQPDEYTKSGGVSQWPLDRLLLPRSADDPGEAPLRVNTDTLHARSSPSILSARAETPSSPLLAPVKSRGLPLVSPLLTDAVELNEDRFASEQSREIRTTSTLAISPSSTDRGSASFPDFSNDGAIFSRMPSISTAQAAPAASSHSSDHIRTSNFNVDDDQLTFPEIATAVGHASPQYSSQSHPEANIFTSNSKLPQHLAPESEQAESVRPSSHYQHEYMNNADPTQELQQGANWKTQDVFDDFFTESPPEDQHLDRNRVLSTERQMSRSRSHSNDTNRTIPESTIPSSPSKPQPMSVEQFTSLVSSDSLLQNSSQDSTRPHVEDCLEHTPDQPVSFTLSHTRSFSVEMLSEQEDCPSRPRQSRPLENEKEQRDQELSAADVSQVDFAPRSRGRGRANRSAVGNSGRWISSDVPDAISPWFGSRRSNRRKSHRSDSDKQESFMVPVVQRRSISKSCKVADAPENGVGKPGAANECKQAEMLCDERGVFQSPIALYEPLSDIDQHLGSQNSQGPSTIDVFAVVSRSTSKPQKSKAGPKDWNTVFDITDTSLHPKTTQVQCFRPFANSLPEALAGDVILLRNFVVKTKTRQCFLLSAGSSAWCVWKFTMAARANSPFSSESSVPNDFSSNPPPECRGPPVELGDQEQQHAASLRRWWVQVCSQKAEQHTVVARSDGVAKL